MTDTIDVAALVERLRDSVAEAIRGDGSDFADGPWETLPEKNKHGWRGDADRALAVVKEYLTPALQSQADALAEARRRLATMTHQFEYEAKKHSDWLERFMVEKARADTMRQAGAAVVKAYDECSGAEPSISVLHREIDVNLRAALAKEGK